MMICVGRNSGEMADALDKRWLKVATKSNTIISGVTAVARIQP
jgi:hypothetical protein